MCRRITKLSLCWSNLKTTLYAFPHRTFSGWFSATTTPDVSVISVKLSFSRSESKVCKLNDVFSCIKNKIKLFIYFFLFSVRVQRSLEEKVSTERHIWVFSSRFRSSNPSPQQNHEPTNTSNKWNGSVIPGNYDLYLFIAFLI